MKKIISCAVALAMGVQMLLAAVPVSAEESTQYAPPETPAITYNMNLDWQFYDTKTDSEIWTAMASADKDGKKFYEKDYDDSSWETVSIPHGIGGGTNSFTGANYDAGGGYRSVLLYRKTITVPQYEEGSKVFFELEGIRQSAYVWVNGQEVGYYEAGITAMGFDLTDYVKPGEEAVIAICNDGTTARGTERRIPYETVPGEKWGSSYTPDNYKTTVGGGSQFVWNTKDFNEPQIGLVYDAYLYVKGNVYQTLPLYNNLKTTGNYIYANNFDIRGKSATINVEAEVRNESANDGSYTVEVAVVDADGMLKYNFESAATTVSKASDAGVTYKTAVESDVYDDANTTPWEYLTDEAQIVDASKRPSHTSDGVRLTYEDEKDSSGNKTGKIKCYTHNEVGKTNINTVDVTHISASYNADGMRFWSTDDPYLYTVYTILKDSTGKAVDVQKEDTGFRKISYDADNGVLINDKAVWMPGYAQRSTNEWAVIGTATDWLQDYDMALLKENNSNFIRWMHVAPKPAEVRSSDKYGVAVVCPAGDKEGVGLSGRQWTQRTEAMRDAMIYFRNSPSVVFWETGNSAVGCAENANDMARIRDMADPYGMRFIGARSATAADQMNYDYNYTGTMYGTGSNNEKPLAAIKSMKENGKMGPIMETEYARDESPRRIWDVYSPPDFDYVNKYISTGGKKDGYDVWNETQEDAVISNLAEYNGYYSNRAGYGSSIYSAAAMMIWSDSNMHTRNTASENCRTSGRVDPVRQKKEMFEGTRTAQAADAAVHIVGHWSYPEVSDSTYNYFGTNKVVLEYNSDGTVKYAYEQYDPTKKLKRDATKKTVYVIGSAAVSRVELYRVDGETETLLGADDTADNTFIYQFDNIDITKGDAVIAKAYDARNTEVAKDEIERTYDAVTLRVTPHTAVKADEEGNAVSCWKADGSDIAYFDVEVLDKNGNVCALNYDKINFTYSGDGVYLGGYNSGSGANCYQNSSDSLGLSNFFGGDKTAVSTIGKDYVYAENGTNRIFVRSTRNAGSFTLSASMDGMLPVSSTITSQAVEVTGGLTTEMQSTLSPGVSEAPIQTTVAMMKPIMENKLGIDWSGVKVIAEKDDTEYYDVTINGTKLTTSIGSFVGIDGKAMFGPIYEILKAVQEAGSSSFTMTYDDGNTPATLEVTKDGHTYQYEENRNQVLIDNREYTECVDMPVMKNGTMVANISLMLGYAGVGYTIDETNHTINITVQ